MAPMSPHSPRTTRAKAESTAIATPSQSYKEVEGPGDKKGSENADAGSRSDKNDEYEEQEKNSSGSDDEAESADNIERFVASKEPNLVAR